MLIELSSLERNEGKFSHVYEPGELVLNDQQVRLLEPPRVRGQIVKEGREVRVEGEISTVIEVQCDRCLKSIQLPLDGEFDLKYLPGQEYRALKTAELTEDDLSLSVFDGEIIDIDEIVREEILLAVPAHPLCEENCKGICPSCGADRNMIDCGCEPVAIDPRWASLKGLVNGK